MQELEQAKEEADNKPKMIINAKEFQDKFEVNSKSKTKKGTSLFNKIMQPFTKSPTNSNNNKKVPIKQKLPKLKLPTKQPEPATTTPINSTP